MTRSRLGLLLALALVLLAAGCSSGDDGGSDDPERSAQACYVRRAGEARDVVFVLFGAGRMDGDRCTGQEVIAEADDCFTRPLSARTSPADPGVRQQILDCLKLRMPNAFADVRQSGLGPVDMPERQGSNELAFASFLMSALRPGSHPGVSGPGCGTTNPAADGAISSWWQNLTKAVQPTAQVVEKTMGAVDDAEKYGTAGAAVGATGLALVERTKLYDEMASGNADKEVTIQDDPRYSAMKEDASIATEAATEVIGDSTSESLIDTFIDMVISYFAGGGEVGPDQMPSGEEMNPCRSFAFFLAECERDNWNTPRCKEFLQRVNNPGCDPTIAFSPDDPPCQRQEVSEEQVKDALAYARIQCWSRRKPDPDNPNVCGAMTPEGSIILTGVRTGGVCGDPRALTTEEQCLVATTLPDLSSFLPRGELPTLVVEFKRPGPPPPGPK